MRKCYKQHWPTSTLINSIEFNTLIYTYIIINIFKDMYYSLVVGVHEKYRYIVNRNGGICHDKNTNTFKKHIGINILSPSDNFFHQFSIVCLHPVR